MYICGMSGPSVPASSHRWEGKHVSVVLQLQLAMTGVLHVQRGRDCEASP